MFMLLQAFSLPVLLQKLEIQVSPLHYHQQGWVILSCATSMLVLGPKGSFIKETNKQKKNQMFSLVKYC